MNLDFEPAIVGPDAPSSAAWIFAFRGAQLLWPLQAEAPPPEADAPPAWAEALQPLAAGHALWQHAQAAVAEPAASAGLAGSPAERPPGLAAHYLGRLGGQDCWALALPAEAPLDGWQPRPLRASMMALPEPLALLAGRAAQILEWDRTHRHCGCCGTPTERLAGERARRCPACGHSAWPRLSPAMMALVWRPGELLLARGPHFAPGMYSALAGFVEPGESLEDCLHREVAEEVGVQVEPPVYFGSQNWPFPHSLMVAYTARWRGGAIVPQPGEIEDARWYPLDALPTLPPPLSIAGRMIRALRDGQGPAALYGALGT
ncbi:NAD(+) diphosphatase [Pseudaquabacterium rugosum]|uniref:NAD(+) diphosphatase n=1 Tax=Pseudaquabacterium rugosum TaxID=2984194 RepID=A0ABU9BBN5_9BURK